MNCLYCNFYDKNDAIHAWGTCEPQDEDFPCTHECNLTEEEVLELESLTGHRRSKLRFGGKRMGKLKPCRYCGKENIVVERWSSGGMMYMVKCNNPDCPVPPEGYPTGRKLPEVKAEWDRRNSKS